MERSLKIKPSKLPLYENLNHSLELLKRQTIQAMQVPNISPPQDKDEEHSETNQEEIQQFRSKVQEYQKQKENLKKKLSETSNQLLVKNALCDELSESKVTLLNERKKTHDNYEVLQNQKIKLMQMIAENKNTSNLLIKKLEVMEERNNSLEKQNKHLHEEVIFKDNLCSDTKLERDKLRKQLTKLYESVKGYEQLKKEFNQIQKLNQSIDLKASSLEKQLSVTRKKLNDFQSSSDHQQIEKKNIFSKLRSYEEKNNLLIKKIAELEIEVVQKQKQIEEKYFQQSQVETKLKQTIISQQGKISQLITEVLILDHKNREQRSEIDYFRQKVIDYQNPNSLLKPKHAPMKSSQFQRLFKTLQLQLQETKKLLLQEEKSKQNLARQLEGQLLQSRSQKEEVGALLLFKEQELKKKQLSYQNKEEELKKDNEHLRHKVQQSVDARKKLVEEINEKDRIIMEYVHKQK